MPIIFSSSLLGFLAGVSERCSCSILLDWYVLCTQTFVAFTLGSDSSSSSVTRTNEQHQFDLEKPQPPSSKLCWNAGLSLLGSAFLGIMALASFLVEGVTNFSPSATLQESVLILVGSATDTSW